MSNMLVAVDVGTGSARAGVMDATGALLGRAEHPIVMHTPTNDHAEQNSEDIWRAVCRSVRLALKEAAVTPAQIAGISFDATCSLVVRDQAGAPLSVSTTGDENWDTIVWLDHRAINEAEECTNSGHEVLNSVGGVMSPEMEVPKLMWLKRNLPDTWQKASYFFDLTDYLTWRASGSLARSTCTLTCKWTYLAHKKQGWQHDFLAHVGLDDMLEKGHVGEKAADVGADLGTLNEAAAHDLGLTQNCRVGAGLIDAHAGTLGVLAGFAQDLNGIDRHLALIAGTSSCVMALSPKARPTAGVWGPYFGAVLPNIWLNEGGQSATGALLDHIIRWHSAGGEPNAAMHAKICARVMALRQETNEHFAERLHVLPDFHGNRSPLSDPHAVGVISGLTLANDFDSLCALYWRTAVGIALGVRHILDALNADGYCIDTLHVSGGHTKNPLLMELYADATGCTVVEPLAKDTVLLGTAMVAATAAGVYDSLEQACTGMQQGGKTRAPDMKTQARYDRDYAVFLKMHEQRQALDGILEYVDA